MWTSPPSCASGVPVLLDAAQALGASRSTSTALGCDFYAASGQKWLCGPEGSGCLYVRRRPARRAGGPVAGVRLGGPRLRAGARARAGRGRGSGSTTASQPGCGARGRSRRSRSCAGRAGSWVHSARGIARRRRWPTGLADARARGRGPRALDARLVACRGRGRRGRAVRRERVRGPEHPGRGWSAPPSARGPPRRSSSGSRSWRPASGRPVARACRRSRARHGRSRRASSRARRRARSRVSSVPRHRRAPERPRRRPSARARTTAGR